MTDAPEIVFGPGTLTTMDEAGRVIGEYKSLGMTLRQSDERAAPEHCVDGGVVSATIRWERAVEH